jgi:uncharacterized coiled-coil protein SlyX
VTWLNDVEYEESREEPDDDKRAVVSTVVGALVLAIVGSGSAFAWRSYASTPYPFFSLGGSSAVPEKVGLAEFQAFQQQIAGQMQTNSQVLATQQADLKRLSEQIAAVSTKMDALQSSIVSARAALSTSAAAKKPTKPKSSTESTGAAPLQLAH